MIMIVMTVCNIVDDVETMILGMLTSMTMIFSMITVMIIPMMMMIIGC